MDRLTIVLTLTFLLAANVTSAQINTSGVLTEDTTWSGTVNVLGDVTVPEGITLTVEPGTVVRFAARSDKESSGDNSTLTELIINGALIAKGTADNMITFTSELIEYPQPRDWLGILFIKHNDPLKHTVNSVIDHCIVEYAREGINCGWGGHYIPAPNITNSIIRKNSNYGLYLGAYNSIVRGNTIEDNGRVGIYVGYSNPTIDGNKITRNEHGIVISACGASPSWRITNNLITDNSWYGVYISDSDPPLGNVNDNASVFL